MTQINDVLREALDPSKIEIRDWSDNSLYLRMIGIKRQRASITAEEKLLKHESALLTKELEKRFTESDTHSIRKNIGKDTWTFGMARHIQIKDVDPQRTAEWFNANGYEGLATVNNRRLGSAIQDLLHDESLDEWVNDPSRLPAGLRACVVIGERTVLSLRKS